MFFSQNLKHWHIYQLKTIIISNSNIYIYIYILREDNDIAKFCAIYYGFSMAVYKGSREMEIDADSIQLLIILIVFELVTTCKLKGKVKDAFKGIDL